MCSRCPQAAKLSKDITTHTSKNTLKVPPSKWNSNRLVKWWWACSRLEQLSPQSPDSCKIKNCEISVSTRRRSPQKDKRFMSLKKRLSQKHKTKLESKPQMKHTLIYSNQDKACPRHQDPCLLHHQLQGSKQAMFYRNHQGSNLHRLVKIKAWNAVKKQ